MGKEPINSLQTLSQLLPSAKGAEPATKSKGAMEDVLSGEETGFCVAWCSLRL